MKILIGRDHADTHQNEDVYVEFDTSDKEKVEKLIYNLSSAIRFMETKYHSNYVIGCCIRAAKKNELVSYKEITGREY